MTLCMRQQYAAVSRFVIAAIAITFTLGPLVFSPVETSASPYTPLEWQREIPRESHSPLWGQRKHTSWIRDRDRDFIDDDIKRLFKLEQRINIIVDLNRLLTGPQIRDLLSPFGNIEYIGKLITFVLVDGVLVRDLPTLAALPEVAMIEWQAPIKTMDGISSPSVQSLRSQAYSPMTAQDLGFTGKNINIAIVDTGVDSSHEAFAGKFVAGANCTIIVDMKCSSLPSNTNNDADGHGTHVAGIALGNHPASSNSKCRAYDGPRDPVHCRGVAIDAGLVDVKVCNSGGDCSSFPKGLDWIGTVGQQPNIRVKVVNISLAYCRNDDGTHATAQQVNLLVSLGIVVVAGHGNQSRITGESCDSLPDSMVFTPAPGSANFAITVQGTYDEETVSRGDDSLPAETLLGPRRDVDATTGMPLYGLKSDLSAPSYAIWSARAGSSSDYRALTGTSMASPHVAGGAAVILEAKPGIDPLSLKDLLKRTADISRNTSSGRSPPFAIDPNWVADFGSGIIDLYKAVSRPVESDVGFPHCVGPPETPGGFCQVSEPQPPWANIFDIGTVTVPQLHVQNTITAQVQNSGPTPATVLVNFGVYDFAVGNRFHYIGTVIQTIPAQSTVQVSHPWTPETPNHICIQISITYGLDANFNNNVTQRNVYVAPPLPDTSRPANLHFLTDIRIENPFVVPAVMSIRPKSSTDNWTCAVSESQFRIDPFEGGRRVLRVTFDPPTGTFPGLGAKCDIAVYATPQGVPTPVFVGGVTIEGRLPGQAPP